MQEGQLRGDGKNGIETGDGDMTKAATKDGSEEKNLQSDASTKFTFQY